MIRIHFNQHELIICHPNEPIFREPNGVFWFSEDTSQLPTIPEFFEQHPNIPRLIIPSNQPESTLKEIAILHKEIHAAGGLVQNQQGNYLFIFRLQHWDLPKGKQEPGESFETTALREVEEECGIHNLTLKNFLCTTYHTYRMAGEICFKHTHWYALRHSGETHLLPQTEEDITDAQWLNKEQIAEAIKNTYPSIIEVLQEAQLA